MEVVSKLRQLFEMNLVIREVLLVLHVVYVSVLNVLKEKKRGEQENFIYPMFTDEIRYNKCIGLSF